MGLANLIVAIIVAMRPDLALLFGITILARVLPAPIHAQTTPVLLDAYSSITGYLGLSPEQLRAIQDSADPYQREYYRLGERQDEITDLLFQETAKVFLQPSELGRLHTERELNRRRMVELQRQSRHATRATLAEGQLVKLDVLEQIPLLRKPANQAHSLGLLADDCVPRIESFGGFLIFLGLPLTCEPPALPWLTSIPEFGPARPGDENLPTGELRYYPHLVSYLELTLDQQERIAANQMQAFDVEQTLRIQTLSGEIVAETAKPEIDSLGLGIRYAEIETLRRRMWDTVQKSNEHSLAVLSPAQRLKYEALAEAVRLKESVGEARSAELMRIRCQQQVSISLNTQGAPFGFELFNIYLGDCVDSRALDELRADEVTSLPRRR